MKNLRRKYAQGNKTHLHYVTVLKTHSQQVVQLVFTFSLFLCLDFWFNALLSSGLVGVDDPSFSLSFQCFYLYAIVLSMHARAALHKQ